MCAASADTMHMASTDAKRALKQVKPMQCHGAARGAVLLLGACLLVCIAAMRANTRGTCPGARSWCGLHGRLCLLTYQNMKRCVL
jgi:hypothetical protein